MNDSSNLNGMPSPLPEAASKTLEQWRDYCAELLAEVERLKAETVDLREQRLTLTQMVPVPDHVKALETLSMEEVLAKTEFQPSFRELVEQLAKEQGL